MRTARMLKSLFALLMVIFLVQGCAAPEGDKTTASDFAITMKMEPASPKVGQNVMTLTVKDKEGEPVVGAEITVDPQMPAHGHGSSEKAKVEDLGDGNYKASPVTLQMKGDWEITVTVKAGDKSGTKVFKLTL